jgi:guanylate kinase
MSKIIFISGPSAMAKSSIKSKLEFLAPSLNINFQRVIISTSRDMRDNESPGNPWWFISREKIFEAAKKSPNTYLITEITGGDTQGLDTIIEIKNKLNDNGILWCELDVNWREMIIQWLNKNMTDDIQSGKLKIVKVFFAPLSYHELNSRCIKSGKSWENEIRIEMLSRMLSRRDAGLDNASDDKIQSRAQKAAAVYSQRNDYDCIIINHQGEESPEWGDTIEFPTGEAAIVLNQFITICKA